MATFLDIGLFGFFGGVFTFLLVFVVVFAFLEYMKIFRSAEAKGWHAIIALSLAALALMSRGALSFITFTTPWFIVLFFVLFFIMFAARMFGVDEKAFAGPIIDQAWPWILVFGIVIVLFGLGHALGQTTLDATTGGTGSADSSSTDFGMVDSSGTGTDTSADGSSAGTDSGTGTGAVAPTTGTGTATSDFQKNLYATLFHPKVLGVIFLLLIATVTIAFMAQRPS